MSHGGDRYRNRILWDFSVNINPLGIPYSIKVQFPEWIDELEHYPDDRCDSLRRNLARIIHVDGSDLLFGNGASELIVAAVRALAPKKILLPVPSFSGYARAIEAVGAQVQEFNMNSDLDIDESILDELSDSYDMLFLTNPNNPTGRYINHGLLEKILDKCLDAGITVMLDECFMELSCDPAGNTCIRDYKRWPNLLILRAFTKTFAIPGIRLGYLIGSGELIKNVGRQLSEWNVSTLAQLAGVAALMEPDIVSEAREEIEEEKKELIPRLRRMGFKVVDSDAGFLLIKHKNPDIDFYQELLDRDLLIRKCDDYSNLEEGYYRIAIKAQGQNSTLIDRLIDIIHSHE